MRRPLRLPHHADAGRPAPSTRASANPAQTLPSEERPGGGPWRRHRVVRRRLAAGTRPAAGDGALQQYPAYRPGRPHRAGSTGSAQSGDLPGSGALRPVLRAGSILADRLLDRRQRRRKRWRRALPQIRPDRTQPAENRSADHRRRTPDPRFGCPRLSGFRSARLVHRLRRIAGDHHRSHGQTAAQTAGRESPAGQFRFSGKGWPRGRRDHRGGDHSRRPGDDGQPRHSRRRRFHSRRLPGRCRGDSAVRT
ncbi:hypothetical protein PS684_02104 [Pseudomonas fluorescens]|nr:hypothetical protein PS684_02104 [Pseudomonas fluorescens]